MVKESNTLKEVGDSATWLVNVGAEATNTARRRGVGGVAADGPRTHNNEERVLVDGVAVKGAGAAGVQPRARRSGWGQAPSAFQACGCSGQA